MISTVEGINCTRCKRVLPEFEFYKTKSNRGFSFHCKGCVKIKGRNYYLKNQRKIIERNDGYYKAKPELRREVSKRRSRKIKDQVLAIYGAKCVCCGELEPKFLSIDHVYNDGAKERRNMWTSELFRKIILNEVDRSRYQILCFNCNMAKAHWGECPHQTEIKSIFKVK